MRFIFLILLSVIGCLMASGETYKGTVGPYEVMVELSLGDDSMNMVRVVGVSGHYVYLQGSSKLNLNGEAYMYPGPDSNPDLQYPVYSLTETTRSGKVTAQWTLYSEGSRLFGEMTTNGKTFPVSLRMQ